MPIYTTSTAGVFIGWENTGSIGSIVPGEISELYVKAFVSTATVDTKYKLISGSLPSNLTLNSDGLICGIVTVNTSTSSIITTSSFTIEVSDNNNNFLIDGNFSITVNQSTSTEYTNLYFKSLASQEKKREYRDFMEDSNIFDPKLIYRYYDANFGKQRKPKFVLNFGVEKLELSDYVNIISQNFYKRRFLFGPPKVAVTKNADKTVRHEIIYVEIIDTNINSSGVSIPSEITFNGITYYPSSIDNIRGRIKDGAETITSQDPSFTKTIQENDSTTLGYTAFVPICFALPGKGNKVLRSINNSGFKFNLIDFDIDRIYVQESYNTQGTKYLLLSRNPGIK